MTSVYKHIAYCAVISVLIAAFGVLIFLYGVQKFNPDAVKAKRPNIIVIIADDVGWNDFSLHGSNQIPTPNIDALGYNGIILDRFYTQSICTPSRTAFLTGNYPIRSGMQGFPLKSGENRSLPNDLIMMPQHMKNLGYKTHLVGKWHLGAAYRRDTPLGKGFDSHFGYWSGYVGYYDYIAQQEIPGKDKWLGFDLFNNFTPSWSDRGKYATQLFTQKSLDIIERHDSSAPLFLMLAHLAAHTGSNGTELGVPDINVTNTKYSYINDPMRRRYADIVNIMDDSVGQIIAKLSDKRLLDNSIVLFFSDNGAQTQGMYANSGSNWPLRGLKFLEFEGGIRGTATIFSPLFKKRGYVNSNLIHITDWLPTFYAAAGGDIQDLKLLDGINQWPTISENAPTLRDEILVNINEANNYSAIIGFGGKFKLVQGAPPPKFAFTNYYGENGRGDEVPPYNVTSILNSATNLAIQKLPQVEPLTVEKIIEIRSRLDVAKYREDNFKPNVSCEVAPCLFDLETDPCETTNIYDDHRDVTKELHVKLDRYRNELVPQLNKDVDLKANPMFFNNTWCTWLDDEFCVKTPNNTKRLDGLIINKSNSNI